MSTPPLADPTAAEAKLLDAAERCIRRFGIRRTSMAEVARAAGFSRAWLYRHFPDKESLVSAVLLRTDEAFWQAARERIDAQPTLVARVVEAVGFARAQAPSDLFLGLMETEPDTVTAMLATGLRLQLPAMSRFWQPYVVAARDRGEVRADLDIGRAAEWIFRMVLSVATIPGESFDADDADELAAFFAAHLVRGLA
ncbi:MAG: TetR/AcrR family transcriptional regulator [Acidimicrobiia bacterium]